MASSSSGRRQSQRTMAGTASDKQSPASTFSPIPSQAQQPPFSTAILSHPTIMSLLTTDQNPYQCGVCSATFSVNMDLVAHVRKHSLTKPYQCGYCKDSYSNNVNLVLHIEKHRSKMLLIHPPRRATHGAGTTGYQSPRQGVSLLSAKTHQSPSPGISVSATTHQSPRQGVSLLSAKTHQSPGPGISSATTHQSPGPGISSAQTHQSPSPGISVSATTHQSLGPGISSATTHQSLGPGISSAQTHQSPSPGISVSATTHQSLGPGISSATNHQSPGPVISSATTHHWYQSPQPGTSFVLFSVSNPVQGPEDGSKDSAMAADYDERESSGDDAASSPASSVGPDSSNDAPIVKKSPHSDSCTAEEEVTVKSVPSDCEEIIKLEPVSNQETEAAFGLSAVKSENHDEGSLEEKQGETTLVVDSTLTNQQRKVRGKECTTDTSDRPFRCDLCGAGFKVARYVSEHKKHVHNKVKKRVIASRLGDRPFRCDLCGAGFKVARYVSEHKKHVHNNKKAKKKVIDSGLGDRPFRCDLCGAGFKVARYVSEHKKHVHNNKKAKKKVIDSGLGDRPFRCDLCGAGFKVARYVSEHKKHVHNKVKKRVIASRLGDRPFRCDLCGAGFKVARYVSEHKKHVHNKKAKKKPIDVELGESLVHDQTVKKKPIDVELGESLVHDQTVKKKPIDVELGESQVHDQTVKKKPIDVELGESLVHDQAVKKKPIDVELGESLVHDQTVKKKPIDVELGESLVHDQAVKKKLIDSGLGESHDDESNPAALMADTPETQEPIPPPPGVESRTEENQASAEQATGTASTLTNVIYRANQDTMDGNAKPFDCNLCEARFKLRRYLSDHMRLVHKVRLLLPGQKIRAKRRPSQKELNKKSRSCDPVHCNVCNSTFRLPRYLRDHQRLMHNIWVLKPRLAYGEKSIVLNDAGDKKTELPVSEDRETRDSINSCSGNDQNKNSSKNKYVCDLCGDSFTVRRLFITHKRRVHKVLEMNLSRFEKANALFQEDPGVFMTEADWMEPQRWRGLRNSLALTSPVNITSDVEGDTTSTTPHAGDDLQGGEAGGDLQGGEAGDDLQGGKAGDDLQGGEAGDDLQGGKAGGDLQGGKAGDDLQGGEAGDDLQSDKAGDDLQGGKAGDDLQGGEAGDQLQGGEKTPLLANACECSFCGKLMFNQVKLRRHLEDMHSSKRPFRCKICSLCFKTSWAFERHSAVVHPEEKAFMCQHCSARFETLPEMLAHVGSLHTRCHCTHCPAHFDNKELLSKHLLNSHADIYDASNEMRSFSCPHCSHTSEDEQNLNAHISAKHKKRAGNSVSCPNCEAQFKTKIVLRTHLRKVHNVETTYQCDQCGKSYNMRHKLKEHFCEPKECPICQRKCSNQSTYNQHINEMHNNRLSFTCELCGQTFARAINLSYHQNSKHFNRRPYKCDICHKSFTSHPGLSSHKIRHRGKKRFNCSHCDLQFYFRNNLERHVLTHTDLKVYSCEICNRMYKSPTAMRYHMKNTHQYQPPHPHRGRARIDTLS